MTRSDKIYAEENVLVPEQNYAIGNLLDDTECRIFLDTGTSKSLMSKAHYLGAKPYTEYQILHLKLRIFTLGMVNMSVYFS